MSDRMKKEERLFFISYGLCLITSILYLSLYYQYFIGLPHRIISVVFILLAVLQELINHKFSIKSFVGLGICGLLFLLLQRVASSMGQSVTACICLYVYCARNISFRKIAKFTLWVSGVTMALVILSGYAGIIPNHIYQSGSRIREFLGFRYTLYPATILFNITCLYIYIRKQRITLLECGALLLINLWMYMKTDARTVFAMSVLLLLVAVLLKYAPEIMEKCKAIAWLMIFSFVICAVFSLSMTLAFDDSVPWMHTADRFLSGRLSLAQNSLNEYGVTAFGEELSWTGNGLDGYGQESTEAYTWVDCFYVQFLQRYGAVLFLAFLFITVIAMHEFYKAKAYHLMIIMACIALRCVIDDLSQYFYLNTFWIVVGIVFYRWSKRRIKKLKKRYLPRLEGLLKGQTH